MIPHLISFIIFSTLLIFGALIQLFNKKTDQNTTYFSHLFHLGVLVGYSPNKLVKPLAHDYYYTFSEENSFTFTFFKPSNLDFSSTFSVKNLNCSIMDQDCIIRQAFSYQLERFPSNKFFFFCDENTYVNLKNLFNYITNLQFVYRTSSDIFRSGYTYINATNSINLKAGFLISSSLMKAFLKTKETIEDFLNKHHRTFIDDGAFLTGEKCDNLDANSIKSNNFNSMEYCDKSNTLYSLNKIVSYYSNEKQFAISIINKIIGGSSNQICYFYDENRENFSLCYYPIPKNIYGYSVQELVYRKKRDKIL